MSKFFGGRSDSESSSESESSSDEEIQVFSFTYIPHLYQYQFYFSNKKQITEGSQWPPFFFRMTRVTIKEL